MPKNTVKGISFIMLALTLAFVTITGQGQTLLTKTLAVAFVPRAEVEEAVETEDEKVDTAIIDALRYHPLQVPLVTPEQVDDETLWLARCIYSETKRPVEQELVAWVLRNRVETRYRGAASYETAVTQPYQFSAFNPESRVRRYYASLTPTSKAAGFQRALAIAHSVRQAPEWRRPFVNTTRHFFSQQSMVGRQFPVWSAGKSPVSPERPEQIDPARFRFYADVI